MLKIIDITENKELARSEMAEVVGGTSGMERLSALIDFSSSTTNKVADVTQGFGLSLAQGNIGTVTNNQAIASGNGIAHAPVTQEQWQGNWMDVYGLGNVSIS